MTDHIELKRLAEAATPGPWSTESNELYWLEDGYTKHLMETFDGSDICHDAEHPANLKFIAAANPSAVLAMIADIERLETTKSALVKERQAHIAQRDQLKVEVEALRKDAERYRYLRTGAYSFVNSRTEVVAIEDMDAPAGDFADGAQMLDVAVDAAMSKEAGQ